MVWPIIIAAGVSAASAAVKGAQASRARKMQARASSAAAEAHQRQYSEAAQAGAKAAQAAAMQMQMSAARGSGTLSSQASAQQAAMQRAPQMAAQAQLAGARIGEGYAQGANAYMGQQTNANMNYSAMRNDAQNALIAAGGDGAKALAAQFGGEGAGQNTPPMGAEPAGAQPVAPQTQQPVGWDNKWEAPAPSVDPASMDDSAFEQNYEKPGSDRRMKDVYSDEHSKEQIQALTSKNSMLEEALRRAGVGSTSFDGPPAPAETAAYTYVGEPGRPTITHYPAQMDTPAPPSPSVDIRFEQARMEEPPPAPAYDTRPSVREQQYYSPAEMQYATSDEHSKERIKELEGELSVARYENARLAPRPQARASQQFRDQVLDGMDYNALMPSQQADVEKRALKLQEQFQAAQKRGVVNADSIRTAGPSVQLQGGRRARLIDLDAQTQQEGARAWRSDDPSHKFGLAREPEARFGQQEVDTFYQRDGGGGSMAADARAASLRSRGVGRPLPGASMPPQPGSIADYRARRMAELDKLAMPSADFNAPKPTPVTPDWLANGGGGGAQSPYAVASDERMKVTTQDEQAGAMIQGGNQYRTSGYGAQEAAFMQRAAAPIPEPMDRSGETSAQLSGMPGAPAAPQGGPVAAGPANRQDVGANGAVDLRGADLPAIQNFLARNPDFVLGANGIARKQGQPEHGQAGVGGQPRAPRDVFTGTAPGQYAPQVINHRAARDLSSQSLGGNGIKNLHEPSAQPNAYSSRISSAGGFRKGVGYDNVNNMPESVRRDISSGRSQNYVRVPILDLRGGSRRTVEDPTQGRQAQQTSDEEDAGLESLAQRRMDDKMREELAREGAVTSMGEAESLRDELLGKPKPKYTGGGKAAPKPAAAEPAPAPKVAPKVDGMPNREQEALYAEAYSEALPWQESTIPPEEMLEVERRKLAQVYAKKKREKAAEKNKFAAAQKESSKKAIKNVGAMKTAGFSQLPTEWFVPSAKKPKSDERSKDTGGRTAASKVFEKTPGYSYQYKPEFQGQPGTKPGMQVGIMAQDLEKTPAGKTVVDKDQRGMRRVDTSRLSLLTAAGMHDVMERLKKLEKQKGAR